MSGAGPRAMALGLSVALFFFSDRAPAQPPAAPGQRQGTGVAASSADEVVARFRREWTAEKGHMRPLDDRGWKARMTALKGLIRPGPEAVAPLVRALDDENAELRVIAAQALGFVGDARVAKRLERALAEDKAPAARLYVADSLGMIGGLRSKPLFERIAAEDPNKDVQAHMRFALERKGEALPQAVREDLSGFDLTRLDTAEIDKAAPDFALTDALGQSHRLSDFRGKKAVVLIFIYGDT
jgi:HEAT repeat protein